MNRRHATSEQRMARYYDELGQQIARAQLNLMRLRAEKLQIECDINQLQHYGRRTRQARGELFLRMMNAMSHRRFCRLMGI